MSRSGSRKERQLEQLRCLCASGALNRAIDLAFEHFAEFGVAHDLVVEIEQALERTGAPASVHERFATLCAGRSR